MNTLRARLREPQILAAPGIYDALTATIAMQAGFEALYLSGAAVAYTRLGRPDIGLASVSEMADTLALITERVSLPIIIDADAGFGNALNARRTMQQYERAGACALQLEDQTHPKRCGHLSDKQLVSTADMTGKIKAMLDVRKSDETLLIARTDAIAVEGFTAALDRADAYLEAGADSLFIEAPRSVEELQSIAQHFAHRTALLANMVEGGLTPMQNVQQLQAMGYSLVIFPGGVVRAMAKTASDYYQSLHQHGSNLPFADRMFDFDGLNQTLETPKLLQLATQYADSENH